MSTASSSSRWPRRPERDGLRAAAWAFVFGRRSAARGGPRDPDDLRAGAPRAVGSGAAVLAAGPEEWLTVPGIGPERARALAETVGARFGWARFLSVQQAGPRSTLRFRHGSGTDRYTLFRFTCDVNPVAVETLVGKLDLRVALLSACPACLVSVSSALASGDVAEIGRALRFFGPLLWDEGLGVPVQAALAAARNAGIESAGEAIADVERCEGGSPVFHAAVRRLALLQREEAELGRITSLN